MMIQVSISECVILKTTKLGRYHRTTVPEEVRKPLDLREGNKIAWILEGSRIIVKKVIGSKEVNT